ncbi:unnamed protein product [Urochloa humidicola]
MEEEEARLRFAIIARVGNASREFSPADVSAAVAEATGLGVGRFPTFPSYPDSFLIICNTQEARDRALNVSPLPFAATMLSLRPWNRLVRANSTVLYNKVRIEIDGIPEHAWNRDTADKLLAKHAWIECLDPATANKTDLSTFRLTAWTADPLGIPDSKTLCIAEPEQRVVHSDDETARIFANVVPYLRQKVVLRYPIHFHLRSITDFSPRTPSTSSDSPSDDGDSGPDGNPDRSYGFRSGTGPRLSGFPRRRHNGDGGSAAAGGGDALECSRRFVANAADDRSKTATVAGATSAKFAEPTQHRPSATDSKLRCAATPADGDGATVDVAIPTKELGPSTTSPAAHPDPAAEDWAISSLAAPWRANPQTKALDPMLIEALLEGHVPAPKAILQAAGRNAAELSRTGQPCSPAAKDPMRPTGELTGAATEASTFVPDSGKEVGHAMDVDSEPAAEAATVPAALAAPGSDPSRTNNYGPNSPPAIDNSPEPNSPPGFSKATRREVARLQAFTAQVQAKIQTPLLPRPAKMKRAAPSPRTPALPKRSSRLASHPLANVASSKRAEVMLMRRFDMIPDVSTPTTEGEKAYEKLYRSGVHNEHFEAMNDLLPALQNVSPLLGLQA